MEKERGERGRERLPKDNPPLLLTLAEVENTIRKQGPRQHFRSHCFIWIFDWQTQESTFGSGEEPSEGVQSIKKEDTLVRLSTWKLQAASDSRVETAACVGDWRSNQRKQMPNNRTSYQPVGAP